MLYACYELIRPDVIMEISWRKGLHDFTMPFMINFLCEQTRSIEFLKKDQAERQKRENETRTKEEGNTNPILGSRLMLTQGPQANGSGLTPQATGYGGF